MPLVLLIVIGPGNKTEPGSQTQDFESIWQAADTLYAHFELKGIDWDEVYQRLLPRAQQARDDGINLVLLDLLAELKDQHVWFQATANAERIEPYRTKRSARDDGAFSLNLVESTSGNSLQSAAEGRVRYAMLENNIGYIYLSSFNEDVQIGFFNSLASLQGSDALIVDIRHNRGGELSSLIAIAGRFTNRTVSGLPTYVFGNHEPSLDRQIVPTGAFQYTQRVVLLINGVIASAGESFAAIMKEFPSVTAIGDTTAGAGGAFFREVDPNGIVLLSSGQRTWIPMVDLRQYDGTPVEWLGVPPDIHIVQTTADVKNNIDKQLEFAIDYLNTP